MVEVDTVRRLRVLAERDPGVLLRVLERFANLNVIPDRFTAVRISHDEISVEVEVTGVSSATVVQIATKIAQLPAVLEAHLDSVNNACEGAIAKT